jgi:hypothetical protein
LSSAAAKAAEPLDPPVDQPAAIPERGEHELTLAGVTYRLRPSHAATRAIEAKTGVAILPLARLGARAELSSLQLGIIAAELIKAGAEDEMTRRVNAERIEELIFEEAIYVAQGTLSACLVDAATGGRTASGEAKAAAA